MPKIQVVERKNENKEIVQKLGQEIFQGRATEEAKVVSNADELN